MGFTWAGIDEFCAVAEGLSFSKAAIRLGLSPAQVSREVARLEDRLGQRLFYRSTRRVSLTESGQKFFDRCRQLIEDRDEAVATIVDDSSSGELRGQLRMTCSERFVVPMINRFMLKHPNLNVEILLWNELLDLVEQGMDLAVRFGPQRDSGLVATLLGSRTRYLCAMPGYLEKRGAPNHPNELDRYDCICAADEIWPFHEDGQALEYRPQSRFRCNSGYAVIDAALEGLGICQLPQFYVEDHIAAGTLIEILPAFRPQPEEVWAVFPHRRHVPLKVRAAIEHLQMEFRTTRR